MSGQGMLGAVGFAIQTSYQNINTGSLRFVPAISETFTQEIESMLETGMYHRFSEPPRHKGMMSVTGEFTCEPGPTALGMFALMACGSATTTFTGSVATHKYRPRDASDWDPSMPLPGVTALVDRDVASGMAYHGMNLDQLQLEIAQGALMKLTTTWVGAFYSNAAEVAPVYPVEKPFVFNVVSASFGGQAVQFARGVTLTLRNNIARRWTLNGSLTPSQLRRENFTQVTGRLNLYFESNSLMADFQTPTPRQLLVTLLSDVASPAMLVIDVPRCRLTTYAPTISGPAQIELAADFVGELDTTSSYQLELTVVNTTAVY